MKLFVAAKAVIQNVEGKVLILREATTYEEGTNVGKYDVPGGRIDEGESLHDALRREVLEEAGVTVEIGEVLHVADTFNEIKGETVHIVRIYFACQALSFDVAVSDDHDVFEWIDPAGGDEFALMPDAAKAIATLKGK